MIFQDPLTKFVYCEDCDDWFFTTDQDCEHVRQWHSDYDEVE